jgi:hypothetical protein
MAEEERLPPLDQRFVELGETVEAEVPQATVAAAARDTASAVISRNARKG